MTIGLSLLGEVVVYNECVVAVLHPLLPNGRTGVRSEVLEYCLVTRRGVYNNRVLHCAVTLKSRNSLCNR